ncbi:MAG: tRNA (adenosine(37)-N6)-threonylcarbamoyltransferase complex transferase subunit TsaD [Syntrophomonadaceae bacterium]|jgi:N6-L-threonylcarbamoyladenine synthase|nr:tRNA (adenosine(37)-N6)-threonylcarbamoyltransferase complex transferase subunit TsaD [Syntrophomonadaceae bacterium]
MNDINILGIETSCDETAAAVVRNGNEVLSDIINSQIYIHQKYGGVVPEIASRQHVENIGLVVAEALRSAGVSFPDIDAVAVTNRPGLIGALLVGLSYAKALAYGLNKPFVGVNHLEGHIYANFIEHPAIKFPLICLLVSGGHTSLIYMENFQNTRLLGATRDDAAGEAFDKVSRFLGLGYPGGPAIEKVSAQGTAGLYTLPRPYLDKNNFEFSFSGLKTAAMNMYNKLNKDGSLNVCDLAAEFQEALVEVLAEKTFKAALRFSVPNVLIAGGVAANSRLREMMRLKSETLDIPLFFPSVKMCTDNAAMIAGLGYHHYKRKNFARLDLNAYPGL